jgi:hypothetical protein
MAVRAADLGGQHLPVRVVLAGDRDESRTGVTRQARYTPCGAIARSALPIRCTTVPSAK